MFPGETWEGEKFAPGWVVLGAEKDQTASCPLNRAMNWVKLTLGDATVAVCKWQPAPPRALLPDSGRGVLSAPGCRALDPGVTVVVTFASAPPLRPRQSGWLAKSVVMTWEAGR